MTDFKHLLSPIQIGKLQIRNRVLVSAHVPGFAEDNKPGERYISYHRQYAENGVGLQITGGTPVHRSGMLGLGKDSLWNLNDGIIPGYRNLSDAVHQHGGRILAQLAHSAGTVMINHPGYESWSASSTRPKTSGNITHEMRQSEIAEVTEAFAMGAGRAAQGGMDGVEILAAFGFLPQAFLSPLTNLRRDSYGGCLENRMRFLMELLNACREAIGEEKILGIRLPGDEFEPGGLDLPQMKEICRIISDSGLADYVNITAYTNFSYRGRSKHWAPTPTPHGVFVKLASAIKEAVQIPVFTVGRVINPKHAEKILAEGKADMVGMTRAHICDPEILTKIKNNEADRIRPCVGANTCIANRYAGKPISCMHNPQIVNANLIPEPAPDSIPGAANKTQRIAVIGAGPAGLEAARVAAERGHHVTLFESNPEPGGQLALWSSSHSMAELGKIIDWRVAELKRLNVTMHFNSHIDQNTLLETEANSYVIATGARDQVTLHSADSTIQVITPQQLLRGESAAQGANAIVYNEGRGHAGMVAAEALIQQGFRVEIVTSDYAVAADLDPTHRSAWYERLGKAGVVMTAQLAIEQVSIDVVQLKNVFSESQETRKDIDLIVEWTGCRANDSLHYSTDIKDANTPLYPIGDCVSPRNVELAISEGFYIARSL